MAFYNLVMTCALYKHEKYKCEGKLLCCLEHINMVIYMKPVPDYSSRIWHISSNSNSKCHDCIDNTHLWNGKQFPQDKCD